PRASQSPASPFPSALLPLPPSSDSTTITTRTNPPVDISPHILHNLQPAKPTHRQSRTTRASEGPDPAGLLPPRPTLRHPGPATTLPHAELRGRGGAAATAGRPEQEGSRQGRAEEEEGGQR
ncbi:unnamed protein product, partial [Tuber aestivum]